LAVIFNFPKHRLCGLLALWLEDILEVLGDFIDLLVWSFGGGGKVICAIALLAIQGAFTTVITSLDAHAK
jgi:hypothetical protein